MANDRAEKPFETDALQPVQRNISPFTSLRSIFALMLREMYTSYGRSPGGYLWAILEPVIGIIILTALFSLAFVSPPLGTNFALFYATGMVPFLGFSDISNKVAQSIHYSQPLLAYPRVSFVDAIIARFLLNGATQILVIFIVFGSLLAVVRVTGPIDYIKMADSVLMLAVLSLGVGTFNCFMITQFPVWQRVWGIVMRPMFILSCVFFLFDMIPQPHRDYLWYNPLIHVIGQMRSAIFATYDASYVSHSYTYGFGLIALLFGLNMLLRYHRALINR